MRVSNLIYNARRSNKIKKASLARETGIHVNSLDAYENCKVGKTRVYPERMSLSSAAKLARVLGINAVELLEAAIEDEKENGKARK